MKQLISESGKTFRQDPHVIKSSVPLLLLLLLLLLPFLLLPVVGVAADAAVVAAAVNVAAVATVTAAVCSVVEQNEKVKQKASGQRRWGDSD